jgi:ElaB/YqjD/DUF883 family membrane-anchored ribosome-binding protein
MAMEHGVRPGESHRNGPLPDDLQVRISKLREGLADLDQRTRSMVREHPVASVVGAVALGYFVGRLFSRRW